MPGTDRHNVGVKARRRDRATVRLATSDRERGLTPLEIDAVGPSLVAGMVVDVVGASDGFWLGVEDLRAGDETALVLARRLVPIESAGQSTIARLLQRGVFCLGQAERELAGDIPGAALWLLAEPADGRTARLHAYHLLAQEVSPGMWEPQTATGQPLPRVKQRVLALVELRRLLAGRCAATNAVDGDDCPVELDHAQRGDRLLCEEHKTHDRATSERRIRERVQELLKAAFPAVALQEQ